MKSHYYPNELVGHILETAWLTCDGDVERWQLFSLVSCLNKQWGCNVLAVALRHVIVASSLDISRYSKIVSLYSVDADDQEMSAEYVKALRQPSRRLLLDLAVLPMDCDTFIKTYDAISSFTSECTSAKVFFPSRRFSAEAQEEEWVGLFSFLSQLRSLHTLDLIWFSHDVNPATEFKMPKCDLPAVKSLSVAMYPRCVHEVSKRKDGHDWSECNAAQFLVSFPNLKRFHLLTPHFLKYIWIPDTVDVIILDMPPFQPPFPSLIPYNIGPALHAGILKRSDPARPPRRIVVHTGPQEPVGWSRVQATCNAHGVILERRPTFVHRVLRSAVEAQNPPGVSRCVPSDIFSAIAMNAAGFVEHGESQHLAAYIF